MAQVSSAPVKETGDRSQMQGKRPLVSLPMSLILERHTKIKQRIYLSLFEFYLSSSLIKDIPRQNKPAVLVCWYWWFFGCKLRSWLKWVQAKKEFTGLCKRSWGLTTFKQQWVQGWLLRAAPYLWLWSAFLHMGSLFHGLSLWSPAALGF